MTHLPDSTTALLERCLDHGAGHDWAEFIRLTYPLVSGAVWGITRRWPPNLQDHSEDLTQDVYLRLCSGNFGHLRKFSGQGGRALGAYLRTVATSVAVDWLRSSAAVKRGSGLRVESLETVALFTPHRASSGDVFQRRLLWIDIDRYLSGRLSRDPRNRWIFYLYYRAGLSARAIASIDAIGLSPKGVESAICRLTRQVRQHILENPSPEADPVSVPTVQGEA